MKIYDRHIESLIELAENEILSGNYAKANDLLTAGLFDEPGYPKLHYTVAWMNHYHIEDLPKAERHYNLTILFDPEFEDAYEYLVNLYFKEKEFEKLAFLLARAQKVENLDQCFVQRARGKMFEMQNAYSEAIKSYRRAIMHCMDNDDISELRKNVKRARFKKFKSRFGS